MIVVCAWCQKYMGDADPKAHVTISHGICRGCVDWQEWREKDLVLVVSRLKAHAAPVLRGLLQGVPEVRLVVDRRLSERRGSLPPRENPGNRRVGQERRKGSQLVLA